MSRRKRILFICGRGRLRSPTAEQLFANLPGVEADSAGISRDADKPLTHKDIAQADLIFVMERAHLAKLRRRFVPLLRPARILCLDIPDRYAFMAPELVAVLKRKVAPHLPELQRAVKTSPVRGRRQA